MTRRILAYVLILVNFAFGSDGARDKRHIVLKRRRVVNPDAMASLFTNETAYSQLIEVDIISGQMQFSTVVNIGTPASRFELVVDTGSSDLWVEGTSCVDCNAMMNRFSPSRSESFVKGCKWHADPCVFETSYGSGNSLGIVGRDTVSIGDFPIDKELQFGTTLIEDGEIPQVLATSGILGLGFESLATYTHPAPSSYLDSFALLCNETGGVLSLNGILHKYRNSSYQWAEFPVEKVEGDYNYWALGLPELSVGGTRFCGMPKGRCQVILDSGTGLIAAPPDDWENLVAEFKKYGCRSTIQTGGLFICHKDSIPNVQILVGTSVGYRFHLPQHAYTLSTNDPNWRAIGIIPSPIFMEAWIFGNIFLTQYYVQYDIKDKMVRITREETNFHEYSVPIYEQPSYFDQYYDVSSFQTFIIFCILSSSMIYICCIFGKNGFLRSRTYEEPVAVSDDTLLVQLLSAENGKTSK